MSTPDPNLVRILAYQRYQAVAAKVEKLDRLGDPARNSNWEEAAAARQKSLELMFESMVEMERVKAWLAEPALAPEPKPFRWWQREWLGQTIIQLLFWGFWIAIGAWAIKDGLERNVPPESFLASPYEDGYPDIDGP